MQNNERHLQHIHRIMSDIFYMFTKPRATSSAFSQNHERHLLHVHKITSDIFCMFTKSRVTSSACSQNYERHLLQSACSQNHERHLLRFHKIMSDIFCMFTKSWATSSACHKNVSDIFCMSQNHERHLKRVQSHRTNTNFCCVHCTMSDMNSEGNWKVLLYIAPYREYCSPIKILCMGMSEKQLVIQVFLYYKNFLFHFRVSGSKFIIPSLVKPRFVCLQLLFVAFFYLLSFNF